MKYQKLGRRRWKVGKYLYKNHTNRGDLHEVWSKCGQDQPKIDRPLVAFGDILKAYGVIVAAIALGALVSKLI